MDSSKLEELIALSSKRINRRYYNEQVISAAIGNIWTVDEQLILDGTYWLAENEQGQIIGCGGWSKRNLLFGNNKTMKDKLMGGELDPNTDPAKIRAFFVHPDFTGQGIGKRLMQICENEAKSNGFTSLELVVTLSGEKLYLASGFIEKRRIKIDLGDGISGEAVVMKKSITA